MRYGVLDALRGVAIVLMVVFHVGSLGAFLEGVSMGMGWRVFGMGAGMLFVLLSGVVRGMLGVRSMGRAWRGAGVLAVCAGMVTLGTLVAVPLAPVHFGILHFFAVSGVLMGYGVRLSTPLLVVGAALSGGVGLAVRGSTMAGWWGLPFGVMPEGYASIDYYPLLPYLGLLIVGVLVGRIIAPVRDCVRVVPRCLAGVAFLGRYSLVVYMVHVPLLAVLAVVMG